MKCQLTCNLCPRIRRRRSRRQLLTLRIAASGRNDAEPDYHQTAPSEASQHLRTNRLRTPPQRASRAAGLQSRACDPRAVRDNLYRPADRAATIRCTAVSTCARIARKTQPEKPFATGTEGGSGRETDVRFVDQAHREPTRVGFAVNREEQVERALGWREARTTGCAEQPASQISRPRRARSIWWVTKLSPRSIAATAALCMNCATPEVEYWIMFSIT